MSFLRNRVDSQAVPTSITDQIVPIDPATILVLPYSLRSTNAVVRFKTVHPLGPQPGDSGKGEVVFRNNGLSLTPDVRAWLELAGQNQVGLTVRHDRGAVPEPWDSRYVVGPQDGSVPV